MRLIYREGVTPDDYEPEGFESAGPSASLHFKTKPVHVDVRNQCTTAHNSLSVSCLYVDEHGHSAEDGNGKAADVRRVRASGKEATAAKKSCGDSGPGFLCCGGYLCCVVPVIHGPLSIFEAWGIFFCGAEQCPVCNGKHELVVKSKRVVKDEYVMDPPECCKAGTYTAKDRMEVCIDFFCPIYTIQYELTHCCTGPLVKEAGAAHSGAPPAGEVMER